MSSLQCTSQLFALKEVASRAVFTEISLQQLFHLLAFKGKPACLAVWLLHRDNFGTFQQSNCLPWKTTASQAVWGWDKMYYSTSWAFCNKMRSQRSCLCEMSSLQCVSRAVAPQGHILQSCLHRHKSTTVNKRICLHKQKQLAELFSLNDNLQKSCHRWDSCSTESQPSHLHL
jgi:hypothetical protein